MKAMSAIKAETTRAMPRVTPTQSKRRIWDPGRSEAHVVLRGVNVGNKHDRCRHGMVCVVYGRDTDTCVVPSSRGISFLVLLGISFLVLLG